MSENQSAFQNAMTQLKAAADVLKLDAGIFAELSAPKRLLTVSIPVRMDNGTAKVFTAYRSQYNNARGPFKGGIRYHWNVSEDEVKALSFWMTMKCSAVGLPLGGGKGGIIVNPKELSLGELERLSRGYIQQIYKYLGPDQDIPAPDYSESINLVVQKLSTLECIPVDAVFERIREARTSGI
jgi:glutamate dehydrogenase